MSDFSHLPSALAKRASWLINAGIDDTKRGLESMTGTPDDITILQAAIAAEQAMGTPRSSRLKPMQAKLRKFSDAATANTVALIHAKNAKPENAGPSTPEIIPPREAILSDASKALEKLRGVIATHEDKFLSATLGPRLQIGLQCLKAHQVFTIPEPGKRNKSGKNQHSKGQVTRDVASPEGFEGWLTANHQWLKKPTAYKYMTAVRGLGLDHTATEKQVAHALKLLLRKGPVTIASLCAAALEAIAPPAPEPPKIEQQEFDFLKQGLSAFRQETEALLALKDKLDAYPDFKRAAIARAYSTLHELTGTWWQPSDQPDDLANVDPDAITI